MILDLDIAGRQLLGRREKQEDDYAFAEFGDSGGSGGGLLLALADGMGGRSSGERASACAVGGAIEGFLAAEGVVAARLARAFERGNLSIRNEVACDPLLSGMGSTLICYALTRLGMEFVSAGDSKLYIFGAQGLRRINRDQSMAEYLDDLAAQGLISRETALSHPERSALRCALVGEALKIEDASAEPLALDEGDMILAASDGITTLPEATIAAILSANRHEAARSILALLMEAIRKADQPKQDNVTATLLKLGSSWQDSLFIAAAAKSPEKAGLE